MKHLKHIVILSLAFACSPAPKQTSGLLIVDVAKDYPAKEILLQDIAEIEYIPIATTDSTLVQEFPTVVSDKGIAMRGGKVGELLLFDRKGQTLKGRICRHGQGPEEYTAIIFNIVDWQREEVFIADYSSLKVYDFAGNYLRTLANQDIMKLNITDFNADYLLASYNREGSETPYRPYFLLSKEDGRRDTLAVEIPRFIASERKVLWDDGRSNDAYGYLPQLYRCADRIWLTDVALDTVFVMHPDQTLEAAMAPLERPSANPEAPLLFFRGMNDRYAWISSIPRKVTVKMGDIMYQGERNKLYMHDRRTGEWFEPAYRNSAITNPEMAPRFINLAPVPYGYGLVMLQAMDLVEAYNQKQIADEKLAAIASRLQEEDNPVLMLLKFK